MSGFRQQLTAMLNRAADGAAAEGDQKYGRQLASLCEKVAVRMRLQFGGRSIWQTRPTYKKEHTE